MTKSDAVLQQLKDIGADFRFWGRSEARELPRILFPKERIKFALNGQYEKGFALLCATDQRLLLLDKKPLILCFEDMRYEMISEVDYTEQVLTAELSLRTPGRTLHFKSFKIRQLRNLTSYIQEQVTFVRHPDETTESAYQKQQERYERLLRAARQQAGPYLQDDYHQESESVSAAPAPDNSYNSYRNSRMQQTRRRVAKFTSTLPIEPEKM